MANTGQHHSGHGAEEYISIVLALLLAVAGALFFFRMPNWTPTSNIYIYALPWLVLGYLAIQLIVLLSTAIDSRSIGFLDSLVSLLPAVLGAVVGIEAVQGIIQLSSFQDNALLLMICTSVLEALITLWVRFTVNKRTIGFDSGNN